MMPHTATPTTRQIPGIAGDHPGHPGRGSGVEASWRKSCCEVDRGRRQGGIIAGSVRGTECADVMELGLRLQILALVVYGPSVIKTLSVELSASCCISAEIYGKALCSLMSFVRGVVLFGGSIELEATKLAGSGLPSMRNSSQLHHLPLVHVIRWHRLIEQDDTHRPLHCSSPALGGPCGYQLRSL